MEHKENLTNERLGGKFTNQFELVNYAIKLAENMVRSGRSPRIKSDIQNPAVIILEELIQGKDHLEDIGSKEVLKVEIAQLAIPMKEFEKKKPVKEKETAKKKSKKRNDAEEEV